MSRDLSLKLTLLADDKMSATLKKGLSTVSTETAKANRVMRAEFQRLAKARESAGVRSEHTVQREIQRTEVAYRRLATSGKQSWREQTRAAEATRKQVTALANDMGRLTTAQKAMAGGRALLGIGAGITAAGYVLKPTIDKAMSYDLRLAHMANTSYSDRDVAGRKAGAKQLDSAIVSAVRTGGGTRDQAAETLNSLIASGAMSVGDATGLLPTLLKAATASDSDSKELANIAIRGMQTFKIKPQDLSSVIDMAIAAGQEGSFELKDMARWLPQQMAAASASGLTGTKGFAKLVSLNQAAAITAGSTDEAGNNVVNLLAKINSADTAQDAKKLGINLPKYLAQQRAKGIDSVDAFVGLVDQNVSKQAAWKQLQAKLKAAKDDSEKRETLESMASIVQGSGIGKLVQDRQALMALVGIMNNREYLADVQAKTLNSAGAADKNFQVISDTASFRTGQAANEKEIAQQHVMDKLTPTIGTLADHAVNLAREYPALTTATVAATTALTALAAAAGAAGLAGTLTGGGAAKVAGTTGLAGRAAGIAAGAAGLLGTLGGKAGGLLRSVGGFAAKRVLPVWGAWEAGQAVGDHVANPLINWTASKITGRDTSLGSLIYDLTHREEQKASISMSVKVDQDARITSIQARTDNPKMPVNVDTGTIMAYP